VITLKLPRFYYRRFVAPLRVCFYISKIVFFRFVFCVYFFQTYFPYKLIQVHFVNVPSYAAVMFAIIRSLVPKKVQARVSEMRTSSANFIKNGYRTSVVLFNCIKIFQKKLFDTPSCLLSVFVSSTFHRLYI